MTHGPPNPQPPFPASKQLMPGDTKAMDPKPDYGEESYKGSGRLAGKAALITGGDSGIGRAVALAFAREGANVLISYLDEHEDAEEAASWVEKAGKRAVLVPGDVSQEEHCKELVARTVKEFGKIDILVNNAAFQATHESIEEISAEEWDHTFRTNIYAYFYLAKAAVGQMQPGGSIIATSSVNAKTPSPELLAYATTKGAIANFTAGLAQSVASKGIRVNCVGRVRDAECLALSARRVLVSQAGRSLCRCDRAPAPAPLVRAYRHVGRRHRQDRTDQSRHPAHHRGCLLCAMIVGRAQPSQPRMGKVGVSRTRPAGRTGTGVWSCMKDGGRPSEAAVRGRQSGVGLKPLRAAVVKSDRGERCSKRQDEISSGMVRRGERKRTADDVSKPTSTSAQWF